MTDTCRGYCWNTRLRQKMASMQTTPPSPSTRPTPIRKSRLVDKKDFSITVSLIPGWPVEDGDASGREQRGRFRAEECRRGQESCYQCESIEHKWSYWIMGYRPASSECSRWEDASFITTWSLRYALKKYKFLVKTWKELYSKINTKILNEHYFYESVLFAGDPTTIVTLQAESRHDQAVYRSAHGERVHEERRQSKGILFCTTFIEKNKSEFKYRRAFQNHCCLLQNSFVLSLSHTCYLQLR